ncbi:hypothetical protein BY458DRAFT_555538 [Sporodiniella umbellata]|nr:hypothetical protein BY458DRAFT_555538 [Sporodiniella umbellata]
MVESTDQASKIVKGEKNKNTPKQNSIETLLNRSIKFRKSRFVDQKLELFKQRFTPINGTTGTVYSTASAYDRNDSLATVEKVDSNGFETPSKTLFPTDKINLAWFNIYPIGPGLKDLGYLSSLNVVLQTLTYTPALANYCLEGKHSSICANHEHCFGCQIENHIKTALNGQSHTIQPRVFVGKLKQLKDASSKDVYNVWCYFIKQLQASALLDRGSKNQLVQQTTALYQIFGGYMQTKLECPSCKNLENKYDFFTDLSLDLSQCSTLERCLSKKFKERLDINTECSSCQHEGKFQGKKSIYRSPKVLTVHLQRFNSAETSTKTNKHIKFESSVDISRIVTPSEVDRNKTKYELYSVITHSGESIHSGQYASYVKSSNEIWYCMNNENVQQVSLGRLLNEQAYMLFYRIITEPVKRHKKQSLTKIKPSPAVKEEPIEDSVEKAEETENKEILEECVKEESEDEKDIEKEKLKLALEESSKKEKIENRAAIVVNHNENMRSKRDKFQDLIDKESEESKSSEAKQILLSKTLDSQFQDSISAWDEDVGVSIEGQRKSVLKDLKSKRKRVDSYNLEYDTGKLKKVKNKQENKFNKPNLFQATANMKQNKKVSTVENALKRQCIKVLDSIHSQKESLDYIKELDEIEAKLLNLSYNSFEEFEADVQTIPVYETTKHNAEDLNSIMEEDCNTPIYDFVTLRKESQVYTLNIQQKSVPLHQSIADILKEEEPKRLVHRLYINKAKELLLKARDDMNSILVLFFNLKIFPFEDSQDISLLTADIVTVHPLGCFHSFIDENKFGIDGWIKVRIARIETIKRPIPNSLVAKLFGEETLSIKSLVLETDDNSIGTAINNEMTRQFINTVMGSCLDLFVPCRDEYVVNRLSESNANISNKKSSLRENIDLCELTPCFKEKEGSHFERCWKEVQTFCINMNVGSVYYDKYAKNTDRESDAEGYFKKVYFISSQAVAQIFQRSTVSQRINEIVSYSLLRDKQHIGCIREAIWKDDGTEIIGMTMERYEMTLKHFLRKHPKLTVCQKFQMVRQLIKAISTIHEFNIAHRDVSTVNFMVNTENTDLLEDGSSCIELFMIDFGKAVFFDPKEAKKWWVNSDEVNIYRDEVKPKTKEELVVWCKSLPFIMAKPDHGYRFYRSIKTLPRHRNDHKLLSYLIDPAAEDIFALGSLIWKVLSGMEPWPGIFDTDLRSLRETVEDDYNIRALINREVPGTASRALLNMCLRAEPFDRRPAGEILSWLESPGIQQKLINEWNGVNNELDEITGPKRKKLALRRAKQE